MRMRVRIGKDGRATVRVEGGEGAKCLTFTEALVERLGKVEEREMLPEAAQGGETVAERENIQIGEF